MIEERGEYSSLVTFEDSKKRPIYNWFHYKEGFSPELVWKLLDEFHIPENSWILDPFCGTGTTLLAAVEKGYNAMGLDIMPLSVFVSNTKLQRDYDMPLLKEKIRQVLSRKFGKSELKWTGLSFIDIRKCFNRYARNDLLFFKERILEVEDEKIRNFLLLGLLSTVIPVSNVRKDGGVLKLIKRKNIPPVRHILKNRLRRMYKDLKGREKIPPGVEGKARIGDARNLSLDRKMDICITSPPYLNWVDYSKIYALEMALLFNSREIEKVRRESVRSYLGGRTRKKVDIESKTLHDIMENLGGNSGKHPEVVEGYFQDLWVSMRAIHDFLKPGGIACMVIGNGCVSGIEVESDVILAELSQDIGFQTRGVWAANIRYCPVPGSGNKPVRESIVILER